MQNDIIENIRLEMKSPRVRTRIAVRVGDTCTRTLHITLASSGTVVSLENALVAAILIKKPDETVCYNDCVIDGNELHYTITSQTINNEGECICQVEVTFEDGAVITSPEFSMMVYGQVVPKNLIKSQNEYTAIATQLVMAKDFAENAKKSEDAAAESESNAKASEEAAGISEEKAAESAAGAAGSATAAAESEEKAGTSAKSAEVSEKLAARSAASAAGSATTAAESVTKAGTLAQSAGESAASAAESAADAAGSATAAAESRIKADDSKKSAAKSEDNAAQSAEEAQKYLEDLKASGQLTLGNTHDTAFYGDWGKNAYDHSLIKSGNPHGITYEDVGADKEGAALASYQNAVAYTDQARADLINGAPSTLDTLKEIADAMMENQTVVEALDAAIGSKASKAETDSHMENETVHITAAERNLWNSYNEKIEILLNQVQALGYPYTQ